MPKIKKEKPDALSLATRFKNTPSESVVEHVIDELETLLVQRTKEAREYTMKVFWETGKLLREAESENKVNITGLVVRVAEDNRIRGRQMSERNLWFAVKFYDNYRDFESVYLTEFGENISLTKVKKLLVAPKPKIEPTLEYVAVQIVKKYGVDNARKLIRLIDKECARIDNLAE